MKKDERTSVQMKTEKALPQPASLASLRQRPFHL